MLNSPYRTLDPDAADVFYIPAYSGLNCLQHNKDSKEFVDKLFNYLKTNQSQYFQDLILIYEELWQTTVDFHFVITWDYCSTGEELYQLGSDGLTD